MDLIDMSTHPDRDNKWILHLLGHFTKFSWARSPSQHAVGVAAKLIDIFSELESPNILQADNGVRDSYQRTEFDLAFTSDHPCAATTPTITRVCRVKKWGSREKARKVDR